MAQSTVEYPKRDVAALSREAPIRVLHVDDEAGFLKAAKQILEMQGAFRVDTASSVEEAVEKMKKKEFDAIVCDYVMPGKDGLEFLKELRDSGNNIPFIMFTGKGREEVAIRALNLGADRYFNKIGDPETVYYELAHGLREAVGHKKAERALEESEQKLRDIIETSPDAIAWVDTAGKLTLVNRRVVEITGFSEKELVGKSFMDVEALTQEAKEKILEAFKKRLQGIDTSPYEVELVTKNGEVIPAELNASPIYEGGKIVGTQSILRDLRERKRAEQALKESEERFRNLVGLSPDTIAVHSEGKIVYINNAGAKLLHAANPEQLIGKPIMDFLDPSYRELVNKRIRQIREKEKGVSLIEEKFLRLDGTDVDVEVAAIPFTHQGKLAIIAIARDITERKKTMEALKESEERYKQLFEHSQVLLDNVPDFIVTLDRKGIAQYVNKTISDSSETPNVKPEQVVGKPIWNFIKPEFRPLHQTCLQQAFKTGKPAEVKFTSIFNRFVHSRLVPIQYQGKIAEVLAIAQDITERKMAEDRLLYQASLLQNASDAIIATDLDFRIRSWNKAVERIYGWKEDEVLGKTVADVTKGEYLHDKHEEVLKRFWKDGYWKGEVVQRHKNGKALIIQASVSLIKDSTGNPIGAVAVNRDITERKQAEEALKQSEVKSRALIKAIPDMLFCVSGDGTFLDIPVGDESKLALPRSVYVGKKVSELFPPNLANIALKAAKRALDNNTLEIIEYQMPIPLGSKNIRDFEARILPCGRSEVLAITRDITERKKAEDEVKKTAEEFVKTFNAISDFVFIIDKDFRFMRVNKALCDFLKKEPEELIGKRCFEVLHSADEPWQNCPCKKTFVTKKATTEEINDPNLGIPLLITNSPIFDDKGELIGVVHIAKDITERKKTLEKLKVLNEKLGVVGKLTRHDARNKLSAVTMNAFLAKQKLAGNHEALEHLNQIESACGDVERIFEFARVYERIGAEELVYMDVAKTLGETIHLFSDLQGVEVVNDCKELTVLSDSLLRQLFYNLIDNSLKHGEKVSQIRVHYEEAGKDQLKLVYEDDGIGIRKSEKEKIFKEGYGKGGGYGLYLIRMMCEVYGWTIRETGRHAKGAQFTITLPKLSANGKTNYRLSPSNHT